MANIIVRMLVDSSNYQANIMKARGVTASFANTLHGLLGPVALAGIGASLGRLSADFSMTMTKIETLVGLSRAEVDRMRISIKDMAGEVGKNPEELARGLYYMTSSGLDGATAMEALKESAKASSLGMGDLEQVADATTSIMNAYGHEVYNANRVTNLLLKTVKVGKIEADELAGSIGKVIPTASTMGVTFEEVGAALATMSLSGIDAAEATTALNQMLASLLSPSKEANDILTALYGSAMNLRNEIRERGLLAVLVELKEKLGDNVSNTAKLFNEKRALKAMLSLTGAQMQTYNGILLEMGDKTDEVGRAFKRLEEEPGHKWSVLMAILTKQMIGLGDVTAKVLLGIAKIPSNLGETWSKYATEVERAAEAERQLRIERELNGIGEAPHPTGPAEGKKITGQSFFETLGYSSQEEMVAAESGFKMYGKAQDEAFEASQKLGGAVSDVKTELEVENEELNKLVDSLGKATKSTKQFYTEWELALNATQGPMGGGAFEAIPSKTSEDGNYYVTKARQAFDIELEIIPDEELDKMDHVIDKIEVLKHSWREYKDEIQNASTALGAMGEVLSTIASVQNTMNQNNINALNAQHEAERELFESKYEGAADYNERLDALQKKQAEERNKELKKQAQAQKQMAVFSSLLAIPEAYLKGLLVGGPSAPAIAALYASLAAVQAGAIASVKPPSFAIGTTSFAGGVARVHQGEDIYLPTGTEIKSKGMKDKGDYRSLSFEMDAGRFLVGLDRTRRRNYHSI